MIEHYHLGIGNILAAGRIPIIETNRNSSYYKHLKGHFDHVWKISEPFIVDRKLIQELKNPPDTKWGEFKYVVEASGHNIKGANS